MSNFTLLCCCMHWKYLWNPKILWFFSYISKHQLNFLRPFWDIIPLWNGYSAATYTYLPSITVVAVGETDNTCTCCYTSGIFFPKILPFDIVPDDSNSAFGSNNDQLWLDESSEFSLDWNSVVLHWITRVFGFVMITFFYILNTYPKITCWKMLFNNLLLTYFFWNFKVCFDEIIELGTRNCSIKYLCLNILSFLSITFQNVF